MGWAAMFVVLGGVLQIVGVLLVVREIRDVRRRLEEYARRDVTLFLTPATVKARAGDARIVTDPPPPLEARVASLEDSVDKFSEQIANEIDTVERRLTAKIDEDIARATQGTNVNQIQPLAELITGALAGGSSWRLLGVWLIVAGLVFATVGGVWSICIA
jgi:hypothetical protein